MHDKHKTTPPLKNGLATPETRSQGISESKPIRVSKDYLLNSKLNLKYYYGKKKS